MRGLAAYSIFFIVFLLNGGLSAAEEVQTDYLKSYYSVRDGLSQSEVTSIARDKYGFIWVGTRGGLNRFDGYEFIRYKPEAGEKNGLKNPSIESLYADSNGDIWIGTKSGGLGIYDVSQEGFMQIDSIASRFPNRIISFLEDDQGHYWVGSWDSGLYHYNPETREVTRYFGNSRVSSLKQTRDGTIWCSSPYLLRFKRPGKEQFQSLNLGPGYREVTAMVEMPSDSSLWLAGWNMGLARLDPVTWEIKTYEQEIPDRFGMNTYSLLLDDQEQLWVGTWGNGLFRFCGDDHSFQKIAIHPASRSSSVIDYDIVLDLFQDHQKDVWIGTDGGGIVKLSNKRKFRSISTVTGNTGISFHFNTVLPDENGAVWAGTRSNGLVLFCSDYSVERIPVEMEKNQGPMKRPMVKALFRDSENRLWAGLTDSLAILQEDRQGRRKLVPVSRQFGNAFQGIRKVLQMHEFNGLLWVATQQDGLYAFEEEQGRFRQSKRFHSNDPNNSLEDNRVSALVIDNDSNLWIGTYKGLYRLTPADTIPVKATELMQEEDQMLCDIILDCHVDPSGQIWFGTPCSLNSLSKKTNGKYQLKEYTNQDGLTDDYINAVMDGAGYIWASTNAGISRIDPKNGRIQNYDVSDGVGGYNFAEGASAKSPEGTIYFGGYSDLTFFTPSAFEESPEKPEVVITEFKVMNRNVPVSEKGLVPVSINELPPITLNHKQKEFSFEIAALDFKSARNNQYAYRLKGDYDDSGWSYTGTRRHFSFSNLKPGDYTLQLAGSNSNGVWNMEGPQISIEILPPPWKTWYAFLGYLLVLLAIVTLIIRVSLKQERLQNEAQIEHMNRVQEHEMNEYKLRFFTDISHELKTPLTLIKGPVEELRGKGFGGISQRFFSKRIQLIHASTIRLIDLLNQLLEFRKVEAGKAVLSASKLDIAGFVSGICASYQGLAESKSIHFHTDFQLKKAHLWFEPSKMDIIINNLLSNAFNHAERSGKVELALSESAEEIILTVSNTGKPIPKEDMEHLFERYYQASERSYQIHSGFGIGLNLVKRFVELHHGRISVKSDLGGLTRFTVGFPKGDHYLTPAEKTGQEKFSSFARPGSEVPEFTPHLSGKLPRGIKGARILVVEDNEELCDYLVQLLEEMFEVMVAHDGQTGFETAVEKNPDLVLSDVMMPKSDGYELCERIKNTPQTAHIPVILLTAKDKSDDQLMGARKGADAYITKPFDPLLLFEKIKQVISVRIALAEKYKKKLTLEPLNKEITPDEEKLIKKAIGVIEKFMENPDLDSDFVAAEMGMSISTFYRKIKKAVGQSPGEFIKSTRMKMAGRYLKETSLTVSEIVERVGYSDIRNFRKSFKKEFGASPADFRKTGKR